MKIRLPLLSLLITGFFWGASQAIAQPSQHTPLKGIVVRLQSFTDKGKVNDTSCSTSEPFEFQATTDDDGEFMFGHVPSGSYAIGCSYSACSTALRKIKRTEISQVQSEGDTLSSEDPLIQITIDACEGTSCRIAVRNVTPDDWLSNAQSSTRTTITKDWSNTVAWLNSGGGIMLRIDGAHSVISGKIEVQ
jgi:hypothetical protein